MGIINPPLPTVGLSTSTEDAKTRTALSQIEDAANNVVAAQLADNVISATELDAPPAWQSVALTGFTLGDTLSFYKDLSSVVHFKTDVTYTNAGAIAINTTLATLPVGFRPAVTHYFQLQGSLSPVIVLETTGVLRTADHYSISANSGWWFQCHYVALG